MAHTNPSSGMLREDSDDAVVAAALSVAVAATAVAGACVVGSVVLALLATAEA